VSPRLSADVVACAVIAGASVAETHPLSVLAGGPGTGKARLLAGVLLIRAFGARPNQAAGLCRIHPNQLAPSQWPKSRISPENVADAQAALERLAVRLRFEIPYPQPARSSPRSPAAVVAKAVAPAVAAAAPSSPVIPTPAPVREPPAPKPVTAESFIPDEIDRPYTGPCTLMNLRRCDCHWPVGDARPQLYCAKPSEPGEEYCADHAKAMFGGRPKPRPLDPRAADARAEASRGRRAS